MKPRLILVGPAASAVVTVTTLPFTSRMKPRLILTGAAAVANGTVIQLPAASRLKPPFIPANVVPTTRAPLLSRLQPPPLVATAFVLVCNTPVMSSRRKPVWNELVMQPSIQPSPQRSQG